jgi:hypothetical protein
MRSACLPPTPPVAYLFLVRCMDSPGDKPISNPLILAAVVALLAAGGAIYQLFVQPHLNPLHIVRLLAFAAFLALYLLKSRFAWHVFGIAVLVITPAYVLLPRLENHSVRPETLPILTIFSLICIVYLWSHRWPL